MEYDEEGYPLHPTFEVELRRNADGLVRRIPQDYPWGSGSLFYWTDGNMACDCTRAEAFARAAGEPDPDLACGEGEYVVMRYLFPDGTELEGGELEEMAVDGRGDWS